jgi:hypothetical protein
VGLKDGPGKDDVIDIGTALRSDRSESAHEKRVISQLVGNSLDLRIGNAGSAQDFDGLRAREARNVNRVDLACMTVVGCRRHVNARPEENDEDDSRHRPACLRDHRCPLGNRPHEGRPCVGAIQIVNRDQNSWPRSPRSIGVAEK